MEKEADEVGIELAAKACYNVKCSVEYWNEFDAKTKGNSNTSLENGNGNKQIEKKSHPWFSTHPASADRAENLEKLIPKVKMTSFNQLILNPLNNSHFLNLFRCS